MAINDQSQPLKGRGVSSVARRAIAAFLKIHQAIKPRHAVIYAFLVFISLDFAAAAWVSFAPDRLYHCSDDFEHMPFPQTMKMALTPPFGPIVLMLLSLPPFVHAGQTMGSDYDHFIWPWPVVYLIWLSGIAAAFVLPAVFMRLFSRRYRHNKAGESQHNG